MPRPTVRQREEMIDAAIDRLCSGQAEIMQARYDGSRAGMASYAEDQAALRGIGLVTSREVRYSPRWTPTARAARFTATVVDGVEIPATVRGSYVKVIASDGTISYRAASSFRKRQNTRNPRTRTSTTTTHRIMAGDLAPIGNID